LLKNHGSSTNQAAPDVVRARVRMLTKSTDCQAAEKPARQGAEPAKEGVYPDVNDRILQATATRQAEIPSGYLLSDGISAFEGFVSGLSRARTLSGRGSLSRLCAYANLK